MSYAPLVSCVLPTGGRPRFLAQAIRCYRRQSYPHRELIIVDDDPDPCDGAAGEDDSIRYLRLPRRTPLGAKLNLGIEQARGELVQKLDDDDYYAPDFIDRMVLALSGRDSGAAVAALDCFLVLIASTGRLVFSGHGWLAGNSLCFARALWELRAFRPVERAEDWWFLRDHASAHVRVCEPRLAVVVRHCMGHAWRESGGRSVTERFARLPAHPQPLSALVPAEALDFYRSLAVTRRPASP